MATNLCLKQEEKLVLSRTTLWFDRLARRWSFLRQQWRVRGRSTSSGNLIHAQIATVHLEIPDPPPLTKSTPGQILDLAHQLQASCLLKAGWDHTKHPRWPVVRPESVESLLLPALRPMLPREAHR
jgi:hypothetical protein